MADQQSAWGSSLKVVLVTVQCMRQYTENSPGCSTAQYTNNTLKAGGNAPVLEAPSCQINRNPLYRYHNRLYWFCNWPYQYTDYSTRFTVNWYLSESMQSLFFGFSLPWNRNRFIFFKPYIVPTVFPFINFSCQGSFFYSQSSNSLSADRLRCEHRRFYMVTSVRPVLYTVADLGPHGELLAKRTNFPLQPYDRLMTITLRNFTSPFWPAIILLANPC